MFGSLRHRLPRLGRVPRLCLAGACLLLALLSATGSKHGPAPAPSVAVLVAARDLPAGHTLARSDVAVGRWPPELRPAGARAAPAEVVGQRLAGPVRVREPITTSRLVGRDLAAGLGAGQVAVPVPLDDPHAADVVHAGDRVQLLETPRPADAGVATPAAASRVAVVASGALVLAVLPVSGDAGTELVVAADRATAVRITRDRPSQMFAVIVDPP
ncbi:MAG TPA: SAF domain-containing protein [Jatrophihabitans sp.]|nr:SAF domain-containing protein [Jatrophihabitans sp.]